MSGSTIGGVIGAAVGFYFGGAEGARWGWMIGSAIGGAVDPDVIKAPSIGDAQRQTSQAGIPIPKIYGKPQPIKGNLIDGETIARKIKVEEQQGKGGGPVVESERFLLTYAIGICEGPIAGIQRIRRNGELIYDRSVDAEFPSYSDSSPEETSAYILNVRAKTSKWAGVIKIYLGTETQVPDPSLEAIHGVGNAPYFRGLCYAVIVDDDVTQGRGAANIYEFEPVSVGVEGESEAGQAVFSAIAVPAGAGTTTLQRSASGAIWNAEAVQTAPTASRMIWGGQRLLAYGSSQLFYSDLRGETGSWITSAATVGGSGGNRDGCYDGGIYYIPGGTNGTYTTTDGVTVNNDATFSNAISAELGTAISISYLNLNSSRSTDGGATWTPGGNIPGGISAVDMCIKLADGMAVVGYKDATTGLAALAYSPDFGDTWIPVAHPFVTGTTVSAISHGVGIDGVPTWVAATDTGEFAYSGSGSGGWLLATYNMGAAVKCIDYYARRFVAGGDGGNMATATRGNNWALAPNNFAPTDTIESLVAMGCPGIEMPDAPGHYVHEDGVVCGPSIVTLQATDITLRSVVEDLCSRANLPVERLNATDLTSIIIPGYLVATGGTVADAIRPLQQPFVFDTPEIDGKIVCRLRGDAASVTITDDDFLEQTDDDVRTTPQPVEYPKKIHFVVPDPDANYTPTPQTFERYTPDVKAVGEVTVTAPIPFRANETKQRVEIMGKVAWSRAEGTIELTLPPVFSQYVPSDSFNYNSRRWLIEETSYADGSNHWKAVYDRLSNYSSPATGVPVTTPNLPRAGMRGPTLLEWMNLPILRDVDDKIGFYAAVTGILDGWDGCTLQGRVDSAASYSTLATITQRSVLGTLVTSLPSAPAEIPDETNTVRVQVYGDLSSITEEQFLNEGNPCLFGEELCQFQTATLVSTNGALSIYDLSILSRGRLDTVPATHAAGDRFVLLTTPTLVEVPSSWIGQTISLRAVTNQTDPENNAAISKLWTPALLQTEWAPIQLVGSRDGSNNVSLSWNGRARLGTNAVPFHSSYFDGYRVEITKGAVTVIKPNTTLQTFRYTSSEQIADFGSDTGTLTISVYAMNRITGASAPLIGTVP